MEIKRSKQRKEKKNAHTQIFSESKFRMSNNSSNGGSSRNGYNFPEFSLRRFLLQTRAGRYSNRMCDVERGSGSSSSKAEKSGFGATSSPGIHRVRTL